MLGDFQQAMLPAWCILPQLRSKSELRLAMHWAGQCTDTPVSALIMLLFLQFFFLWFRHWQSRADRVLLTWTSYFYCFGALGIGPGALTRAHVRAWRVGVIIAVVKPPSKSDRNGLAIVFPWIVEKTWKTWPTLRIFQPSSSRLLLHTKAASALITSINVQSSNYSTVSELK